MQLSNNLYYGSLQGSSSYMTPTSQSSYYYKEIPYLVSSFTPNGMQMKSSLNRTKIREALKSADFNFKESNNQSGARIQAKSFFNENKHAQIQAKEQQSNNISIQSNLPNEEKIRLNLSLQNTPHLRNSANSIKICNSQCHLKEFQQMNRKSTDNILSYQRKAAQIKQRVSLENKQTFLHFKSKQKNSIKISKAPTVQIQYNQVQKIKNLQINSPSSTVTRIRKNEKNQFKLTLDDFYKFSNQSAKGTPKNEQKCLQFYKPTKLEKARNFMSNNNTSQQKSETQGMQNQKRLQCCQDGQVAKRHQKTKNTSQQKLRVSQFSDEQLELLKEQLRNLKRQVICQKEYLQKQISQCKRKKEQYQLQIRQFKKKQNKMQAIVKQIKSQAKNVAEKIQWEIQIERNQKEQQISNLRQFNEKLQKQKISSEERIKTLIKVNQKLQLKIRQQKNSESQEAHRQREIQLQKRQEEILSLNIQNSELNTILKKRSNQIRQLSQAIAEKDLKIDRLDEENRKNKQEIQELKKLQSLNFIDQNQQNANSKKQKINIQRVQASVQTSPMIISLPPQIISSLRQKDDQISMISSQLAFLRKQYIESKVIYNGFTGIIEQVNENMVKALLKNVNSKFKNLEQEFNF